MPHVDGSTPMLLSCSVGAAPVSACSPSALAFLLSTLYQVPWYSTHALVPSAFMPNSSVWPAMPTFIVMSAAVGSFALLPVALKVMPWESSALAVGSVILLVSPCICMAKSAVNEALLTAAILASLSLTIWSADLPSDETVVVAAELSVDAVSPLPPQPASTATASTSARTRSRTAPRLETLRMVDSSHSARSARGTPRSVFLLGRSGRLLYRRMPGDVSPTAVWERRRRRGTVRCPPRPSPRASDP